MPIMEGRDEPATVRFCSLAFYFRFYVRLPPIISPLCHSMVGGATTVLAFDNIDRSNPFAGRGKYRVVKSYSSSCYYSSS
jgi:hypothetical protein